MKNNNFAFDSPYQPPQITSQSQPQSPPPSAPFDYETSPPPQVQSNTYHENQTGSNPWKLPPGWKVAHRESDGCMYYWNMTTSQTSWSHPLAPPPPGGFGTNSGAGAGAGAGGAGAGGAGSRYLETPENASKRPDSHNCFAVVACILCAPLGIFALIHSFLTYRSWAAGRYGDSYDHSRQAHTFAWWAIAVFIGWFIYYYVI